MELGREGRGMKGGVAVVGAAVKPPRPAGTAVSEEPVSMITSNRCAGVPRHTFAEKYASE